jgi:aldehyde dehydrogenase (NAD+)
MADKASPAPTPVASLPDLVASVRAAFASGRTRPLSWRRAQLRGLIALATENEAAIAAALAADLSRPAFDTVLQEILVLVAEAREALAHLSEWAADEAAPTPLMLAPATSRVRKEPRGVALVIAPWNYPVMLSLAPLVSALAAGNAAVLKPSELAPASAALLGALLPRYLDADAVRIVQGGVEETTALLRERFDVILYTGNGAVARVVAAAAARHLTPTILELGGKNPAFVDASADLRAAARAIVHGRCSNAGQICLAPDYVLVEAPAAAALERELVAAIGAFYGADPRASPALGRIVNDRHFARVVALLDEVKASVVAGGATDAADKYIAPTILRDPPATAAIWRDEVFGPLLCVKPVRDLDEAAAFVNAGDKPLALYVFSARARVAERAMALIQSGGVTLNGTLMHIANPSLPFGGVGASGMGAYHGKRGFDAFSHTRAVFSASGLVPVGEIVTYPPFTTFRLSLLRTLYDYVPARLLPHGGATWLIVALAASTIALAIKVAKP